MMRSKASARSSNLELCGFDLHQDGPQVDELYFEVWGMDKLECFGNRHHACYCLHHEDALRMGGRPQRCGSPRILSKGLALYDCPGKTKIPLVFVIRPEENVKSEADYPCIMYATF